MTDETVGCLLTLQRGAHLCQTRWLSAQSAASGPNDPIEFGERVAAREKEMIEAALRESAGRVFGPLGAAAKLGIPRSTLESKIRSLKIEKNYYKL